MSGDNLIAADIDHRGTVAGASKLPVLQTIARGYREALQHLVGYAIQAAVWAGIVGALSYALGIVAASILHAREIAKPLAMATQYAAAFAEIATMLLGNVVVAMSAYRAAIKNERPGWQQAMRLGRRELRFLGLTLVFYVVEYAGVILLMLLVLMVAHMTGEGRSAKRAAAAAGNSALGQLLIVVAGNLFMSVTVTPFFGLAFALVAVDAPAAILRGSARMSRGYRIRLGAISFLAILPFIVAAYLPYLAWPLAPGTIAFSAREAAVALIGILGVAFATAAFAVAFRTITDRHSTDVYGVFD